MLALLILISGIGTSMAHTGLHTDLHYTGADGAFWQGIIHPLTGLDHWIAFVAVGIVACSLARRGESNSAKMTLIPVAGLVLGMALGILEGELGWLGSGSAFIEYAISLTLVSLGVLMIWTTLSPRKSGACQGMTCSIYLFTAAMFIVGLPHGWAHGIEFYGSEGAARFYGLGAALMTALLCASGFFTAEVIHQIENRLRRPVRPFAFRFAGGCLALHGIALAWMV